MEFKIAVTKEETIEIDKEVLKEECKREVLKRFEKEFEKQYENNNMDIIEICVDTEEIIVDLIDEKYNDWDWA